MKLKDIQAAIPEDSDVREYRLQMGANSSQQHTGAVCEHEHRERVELEAIVGLREDESAKGGELEVCSEACIHVQHEEVEVLSVLARAAKVQKRHSAVSARWDEGNLMRAMTQLRVGTVGWRYGQGAHQ